MSYPTMNKTYMQSKYNVTKCSSNRRKNHGVKYIVVHYTGTTASAKNNCIYFSGGNRNASADYFVDTDGSIYKFNEDCANYYTWHCGDGHGKYGIMNSNSIGIEVVSAGKEYTTAQKKSLKKLVMAIMDDYGVSASNVVRHYDASRKICPAPYAGSNEKNRKWLELKDYITGKNDSSNKKEENKNPSSSGTTQSKPSSSNKFKSYLVKVTASVLNIRKGAGANTTKVGEVYEGDVYTIVDEKTNKSGEKWGKLKSGAGWIALKYTKKV